MGEKPQKETRIHKIYFLNRHHDKYDWDNDDLDDNDNALVEDNVTHLHLAADMPGVDLAPETPGVSQGIAPEDGEIEIINPRKEQLVQSVIHNNRISVAGPDRMPGFPLVSFANDKDIDDSSHECGVITKREPRFEVTTDADLYYASDSESFEEDDLVNEYQFLEELIPPTPEKTGSTTNAHGLRCSTHTSRPPQVTKVSF